MASGPSSRSARARAPVTNATRAGLKLRNTRVSGRKPMKICFEPESAHYTFVVPSERKEKSSAQARGPVVRSTFSKRTIAVLPILLLAAAVVGVTVGRVLWIEYVERKLIAQLEDPDSVHTFRRQRRRRLQLVGRGVHPWPSLSRRAWAEVRGERRHERRRKTESLRRRLPPRLSLPRGRPAARSVPELWAWCVESRLRISAARPSNPARFDSQVRAKRKTPRPVLPNEPRRLPKPMLVGVNRSC